MIKAPDLTRTEVIKLNAVCDGKLNLAGVNLQGIDLSALNLSGANLEGAKTEGVTGYNQ